MNTTIIQKTKPNKVLGVLRIVAAIPLLAIGIQHLSGLAPMLPILEGAGIPFPQLNATVAPIFEILAGALLISGFFGRIGALIAAGSMVMATYAHIVFDWADEPPIVLPLAILAICLWVILRGSGSFSIDRKCTEKVVK